MSPNPDLWWQDVTLRYSLLKKMGTSPAHYRHAVLRDSDDSLCLRLGSITHAMLFDQPYAVFTGKQRRGKDWDAFETEHADKPIANVTEATNCRCIVEALRNDPIASDLLFAPGMVHEERIDWTWRGRKFRSTPDARGNRRIVDLKTTRCADPERFRWDAIKFGYHAQLALYQQAALDGLGEQIDELYIVAVESKAPYCVTTMRLTPTTVALGMQACCAWFERLRVCEESNSWPGYAMSVVDLDMDQSEGIGRALEEGDLEDLV